MNHRAHLGKKGEAYVADLLQKDGFTILERNFRSRQGEIDLIALKNDLLVFVEVKMRQHHYFDLSNVIVTSKQYKIMQTANIYIMNNEYEDKMCRFDVALIEGTDPMNCMYIPNAFNESGCTW